MNQLCRHIQTSGRRCRQVALTNGQFCYYHKNRQPRRRRSIVRVDPHTHTQTYDYGAIPVSGHPAPQILPPVQLLFPEDRSAIQINLYNIALAQAENRIDTRTANSMTWNQQVCLMNLARNPLIEAEPAAAAPRSRSRNESSDESSDGEPNYTDPSAPPPLVSYPVTRVILTPDGDEIAPPVEILEDNEAEPIHHKGCPCLLCAEKYRNHPPELHHHDCQCGLCEEQEEGAGEPYRIPEPCALNPELIPEPCALGPELIPDPCALGPELIPEPCALNPELIPEPCALGPELIPDPCALGPELIPEPCALGPELIPEPCALNPELIPEPCALNPELIPKPRIARAASLLSGSTSRDPLNRPWSVAEYTFGDAIRRHEAQYAARAAAALAEGIEPPPYEPFTTGMIPPGHPDYEEDQQMQHQSNEYWAEHFRKQIAERPDIQQYLDEEAARDRASEPNY
jgi:hypothetical protein